MEKDTINLLLFYFFYPYAVFAVLFHKYKNDFEKNHAIQAILIGLFATVFSFFGQINIILSALIFFFMLILGIRAYLYNEKSFLSKNSLIKP